MKVKNDISQLFITTKANQNYLNVCAPMVRYSKVQFRTLVRNYDTDLTFTPMILADSFCQNAKARSNEFTTTVNDSPLIVQFAANDINDFLDASKLVYAYADGVDLNCGCPQRWAMKDGYGCALLSKPEVIHELVKSIKNSLPTNFSVSVKIRILDELKKTISLCQQLENCGVTFLTVHGRTPVQKSSEDIDVHALRIVCDSVTVPVIVNGGIKTLFDADNLYDQTNCNGVMAASGLLVNPALFSGAKTTPVSCVKLWMDIKNKYKDKITFQCYHHHLVFMLEKVLSRQQKQVFNNLSTFESVDQFLITNLLPLCDWDLPVKYDIGDFIECQYSDEITLKHSSKCRTCGKSICYCICSKYDYDTSSGSYFNSYVQSNDHLDYMDSNMFNET
ncbi:tRNA-dihydrouridine(20a/20b) synthase [NAD(P)+]-like [Papilio machaon]|uniref:tRNA-dihydrouridine(20a/20b) synthase [NAD(P)+]-like n=1 Tax=Papilio machaon TaxID=76193 RepID=UPI001E66590E|nr:tRNA-dihydrouridine(20a/20b) synthase [NAD(P)+]-like [Papilio machaon]